MTFLTTYRIPSLTCAREDALSSHLLQHPNCPSYLTGVASTGSTVVFVSELFQSCFRPTVSRAGALVRGVESSRVVSCHAMSRYVTSYDMDML